MAEIIAPLPKAISRLRDAITDEWNTARQRVVESVVRIGKHLLEAERVLGSRTERYFAFLQELPFTASHAAKFRRIAADPVISNKSNWDKLPPSTFMLYQLSQLPEDELDQALQKGVITKRSTRPDLKFIRKTTYEPFCSIKIPTSLPDAGLIQLFESFNHVRDQHPEMQFTLAKALRKRGLAVLRKRAEKEFDRLASKLPSEGRRHRHLVEHTLQAIRKSKDNTLPADFPRRDHLRRDLGVDVTQPVKQGDIYKVVRAWKIVNRFLPLRGMSPLLRVWHHALTWCDTGNANPLERYSSQSIVGRTNAKTEEKKEAVTLARQILEEYRAYRG